jgi:hypothetical protein
LIAAGKLKGTIRFGTPAEEDLAGKFIWQEQDYLTT